MANQTSFSLRDRWGAQPLWFTFLYSMVLGGGSFGLWTGVAGPDQELREPLIAILSGALFGLFLGTGMTWLLNRMRKKSGFAELDQHARLVVGRGVAYGSSAC